MIVIHNYYRELTNLTHIEYKLLRNMYLSYLSLPLLSDELFIIRINLNILPLQSLSSQQDHFITTALNIHKTIAAPSYTTWYFRHIIQCI